ncbi:hypothetical protein B4098_1605 [Heyndrickxia coagulans]|uniref:Uncharacterized protein n=1 Tax=Heyndrickxia coagulans TaxID=1398 RepID=A0A150JR96_HEYCO|nr:hypothetical protein B4098_1605 [Heyndrickxia coagulans]KYC68303.1 hypothetical protein B4099_1791 [Heyndrickxia coagulans]
MHAQIIRACTFPFLEPHKAAPTNTAAEKAPFCSQGAHRTALLVDFFPKKLYDNSVDA